VQKKQFSKFVILCFRNGNFEHLGEEKGLGLLGVKHIELGSKVAYKIGLAYLIKFPKLGRPPMSCIVQCNTC